MKNKEKYKELLETYALVGVDWGKTDGEIKPCSELSCDECDFNDIFKTSCALKRLAWLNLEERDKEYKDGGKYVPANELVEQLDGMDYCIVRTYSAGVFVAYVESRDGKEAVLRQARRLWYWDGANSLSDIANKGVTKPENCKFTAPVDKEVVTEVIEILYVTKEGKASIEGVKEWTIK